MKLITFWFWPGLLLFILHLDSFLCSISEGFCSMSDGQDHHLNSIKMYSFHFEFSIKSKVFPLTIEKISSGQAAVPWKSRIINIMRHLYQEEVVELQLYYGFTINSYLLQFYYFKDNYFGSNLRFFYIKFYNTYKFIMDNETGMLQLQKI